MRELRPRSPAHSGDAGGAQGNDADADASDPFESGASDSDTAAPARSLKSRAIGYLSRREYSRIELARKLSPYLQETDDLEALLDTLESGNWLSDARFAQSLVHRRASRQGASRIVSELKRNSVDPELVATLDAQLRDTEWVRAQAVWRKKFGTLPATPAERGKQARFLAMRGFSHAIIARLLKGQGADEEDVFFGEPPID